MLIYKGMPFNPGNPYDSTQGVSTNFAIVVFLFLLVLAIIVFKAIIDVEEDKRIDQEKLNEITKRFQNGNNVN